MKKHIFKRRLSSVLIAGILSTTYSSAYAQGSVFLEEIIVTAQKKSAGESVQDVPISITAYSGEQVEATHAVNLTDIGLLTPNASLTEIPTFPGVANFVARGLGTVGASIPSSDPSVGVVSDGVAFGTIYGVVTDLFDLETIEILRGPQGTLFGRNVTGGAVVLRSTRPTDEFVGKVKLGYGSHDNKELSVLLAGPINDNWGAKIAVLAKDRDGYWENRAIGGPRQGASESTIIRPAVSYTSENFDATFIYENGSIDSDGLGAITFFQDGEERFDPYDSRFTLQGDRGFSELDWEQFTLDANWDLWGGKLTSILGYRTLDQEFASDLDGTVERRFAFAGGTALEQDQSSFELRWSGNLTDNITFTTGIYLFEQEYTYAERRVLLDLLDRRGVSTIDHDTQGIFAQADIELSDQLTLTLGGRYTEENKDAAVGLIGDPNAVGNCATLVGGAPDGSLLGVENVDIPVSLSNCQAALNDSADFSNFTPKVGLNWRVSDDILGFASFTRGFRSGGYNVRFTDLSFATPNPASQPGPYLEEQIDAFELGIKSTFGGGRYRINASIFNNEIEDLQRTILNSAGAQEVTNAADATIRGFELDGVLGVTDNFAVQFGFGYTDAEYDSFEGVEAVTGLAAGDIDFVLVPEITYSAAATYDFDLSPESSLSWRTSYSFVDDTVGDDLNTVQQEDYFLIDTSLTYRNDSGLAISLYGKNITDEVYYDFGTNFSGGSPLDVRSFWLTPPRTYGLDVTYEF